MTFVAFFRNVNLGHPRCPTRRQLEEAFLDPGAITAASFLTNGTIAFQAKDHTAKGILSRACESMASTCGLKEPAFLRELAQLEALVASDPFASVDRNAIYGCFVTLLHERAVVPASLPLVSPRGDVEVAGCTGSEALCLVRKLAKSPGSPNAFLEKALGLPATTRAWNTLVRLVAKHA